MRLTWDYRDYEMGVDQGVLYSPDSPGEVWNGLISVQEANDGSEEIYRYVDGVRTYIRRTPGNFVGSIQAFTYPDSLFTNTPLQEQSEGVGLSYRVANGEFYKIHLVYNVKIPRGEISQNQNEADPFLWEFTTLPVLVPGGVLSSHLIIDTSLAHDTTLKAFTDVLYGSDAGPARLPSPTEVLEIFEENSILRIIDHGDGTWTAIGPDDVVVMTDPTTFSITWPSAVYIDAVTYTIHSL